MIKGLLSAYKLLEIFQIFLRTENYSSAFVEKTFLNGRCTADQLIHQKNYQLIYFIVASVNNKF